MAVIHCEPEGENLLREVRTAPPGGLLARGLGRAYGDAALNSGGAVIARLAPHRLPHVDEAAATVDCSAGLSLGELISAVLPRGFMLPVVPGTRHVTVGGAIAADIHGKNHHRECSFGAWVAGLRLVDGTGRCRELGPDRDPELFWATVGGMGATGVIVSAVLRLIRVESSWVSVRRTRYETLDELCRALRAPGSARFQVAWVDGVHGDGDRRRSVLEEGEFVPGSDVPSNAGDPLSIRWPHAVIAPPFPANPLRPPLPGLLNAGWWRRMGHSQRQLVPLHRFFFPLDRVQGWNRVYGPRGFVQYQFVVPWASAHLLGDALDTLNRSGHPPILVVAKAMGESTPAPLSFPLPGLTAAIDLADTGSRLREVLAELDAAVTNAGGRLYLAKDSTTSPHAVHAMYPRLSEWRQRVAELDPHGVFRSDLIARLALR